MKPATQRFKVLWLLAASLAWCGTLIIVRTAWTKSFDYAFLVWNLALASIPLFFSTLMVWQSRLLLRFLFGFLWLLFLPNAPYIITDFMHLRTLTSGPIWLDVLMLSSCAATGLALGYCSIIQIHRSFNSAGKPRLGWILVILSMFLSALGIYLGRLLRWRSIDFFRNPFGLLADIAERVLNPFAHYRAWAVILGFGTFLSLGYLFLTLGCKCPLTTSARRDFAEPVKQT